MECERALHTNSEAKNEMTDPILDEVWRVREELLKRYGGIDGYFRHLQAMDRARARKGRAPRRRPSKKLARTNSTASAASRPTRKKASRVESR